MIVREDTFFQTTLPDMLDGRSNILVLIANPRLADKFQEGELLPANSLIKVCILHSVDNGAHIARSALGYKGERMYILYAGRNTFDRIIDVAKNLRRQDPCGTIIVVSCTCDEVLKRKMYANSIRTQEMDCVVFTLDCGAVVFMDIIVETLRSHTLLIANEATSLP
ncbi:MAG: hypothetical protein AAB400_03775 [Patescibacteria group bacterium]